MANRAILGLLGLVLVGGGATALLIYGQGGGGGLDARGAALLKRHADMLADQSTPDQSTPDQLRDLLQAVEKHPEHERHPGLIRAKAWVYQRLGNSRRAWSLIEGNLIDPVPVDLQLSAEILQACHAETGDPDMADRARTCAYEHYQTSDDVQSLFRAWQVTVRIGDTEWRETFETALMNHAATPEARVVVMLKDYPNAVDASDAAGERFGALLDEFEQPPAELRLALAWWEIDRAETLLAGQQRAEAVQRTFRVSTTARTIIAASGYQLKHYKKAKAHLEWLLQKHPGHPKTKAWNTILSAVVFQMDKDK